MQKAQRQYFQLIPENLLEVIPHIEEYFKSIPGYSIDRLKEIISIIATHIRKDDEGYASLKMEYLRKVVPQAERYIDKLIWLAVIDKSGFARKGISSYKYRFTLFYRTRYLKFPANNPKSLIRIEKFAGELKKRNSKKYPDQNNFLKKMTIEDEAFDFIKDYNDIEWYNYALSAIIRIKSGDIYYTVDNTGARYHSNLTNLPKELRRFIRIEGKSLVNLDIKNCQPYLSILILKNPAKVAEYAKCKQFRMLLETLQVNQTEDVEKYISLVKNGEFYEYLLENFNKNGLGISTRDEVKKLVLQILFDRNNHNSKARRIFSTLFPEVSRVFSLVRGDEKGTKFEDFKRFPILLQRIESHIILDLILKRINVEYPGQIAVTIHDSIMTEDDLIKIERVRKVMTEELFNFIGIEPKIKVEGEKGKKKEEKGEKEKEGSNGHYPARSSVSV